MGNDLHKTKKHLIAELEQLRAKVAQYEQAEAVAVGEVNRSYAPTAAQELHSVYQHLDAQIIFTNAIVDSLTQGICAVDHAGNVTFMNRAAREMLGWSSAELFGKPIHTFIHVHDFPKHASERDCPIVRMLLPHSDKTSARAAGTQPAPESLHCEHDVFRRKDGTTFHVSYTVSPIMHHNREVSGLVMAFEDMTEQQWLKKYLHDSDSRFQATFEATTAGVTLMSLDGHYLQANQRFLDMVGYTAAELTKMTTRELVFSEDHATSLAVTMKLRSGEQSPVTAERRYVRKDHALIWTMSSLSLVRSATGMPQYYVNVVEDITARKQLAEQARQRVSVTAKAVAQDLMAAAAKAERLH